MAIVTKNEKIEMIINELTGADVEPTMTIDEMVEFLRGEQDMNTKRNQRKRGETAKDKLHTDLKASILENLTETPVSISDFMEAHGREGITFGVYKSMFGQLVKDRLAVRVIEKGKTLFRLPIAE